MAEGDVIAVSLLAMLASMTVMAVLFIVGIAMVATYFGSGKEYSIWLPIVGFVFLVLCPAVIAFQIHLLRVKERLVLGEDRFQVVHRIKGEDVVVTQIPYANLKKVTYESGSDKQRVGLDIHDLDEPDTFEKTDGFETYKNINGFHYVIAGGYQEPVATIYEMLCARLNQYNSEQ
jgi:hypothetical protein